MNISRRVLLRTLWAAVPIVIAVLWWHPVRLGAEAPPVRLEVSLSSRQLKVIERGRVVSTYGVAVGKPGHPEQALSTGIPAGRHRPRAGRATNGLSPQAPRPTRCAG
jgi:hypothetical protein